MIFTQQQLEFLKEYLVGFGKKDSSLPSIELPLRGTEEITLTQGIKNVKIKLTDLFNATRETHFRGFFVDEDALMENYPMPKPGEYAFVGPTVAQATVYRCTYMYEWINTEESVEQLIYITIQEVYDINTGVVTFSTASTRVNLLTTDPIPLLFGKIKKYFEDLKAVAFSGIFSDLTEKPTTKAGYGITDVYTKSETYSAEEIDDRIGTFTSAEWEALTTEEQNGYQIALITE